ncbi:Uncharacterised protein [Klebsiella pneumoniae]|nr:Uncharacterised protein [Klebsiella pneumoniae]
MCDISDYRLTGPLTSLIIHGYGICYREDFTVSIKPANKFIFLMEWPLRTG